MTPPPDRSVVGICWTDGYVPAHLPHLTKSTVPRHRADGPRTCLYANFMATRVRRSTTRATSNRPSFSSTLLVDTPAEPDVDWPAVAEDIVPATCLAAAASAEREENAVALNARQKFKKRSTTEIFHYYTRVNRSDFEYDTIRFDGVGSRWSRVEWQVWYVLRATGLATATTIKSRSRCTLIIKRISSFDGGGGRVVGGGRAGGGVAEDGGVSCGKRWPLPPDLSCSSRGRTCRQRIFFFFYVARSSWHASALYYTGLSPSVVAHTRARAYTGVRVERGRVVSAFFYPVRRRFLFLGQVRSDDRLTSPTGFFFFDFRVYTHIVLIILLCRVQGTDIILYSPTALAHLFRHFVENAHPMTVMAMFKNVHSSPMSDDVRQNSPWFL